MVGSVKHTRHVSANMTPSLGVITSRDDRHASAASASSVLTATSSTSSAITSLPPGRSVARRRDNLTRFVHRTGSPSARRSKAEEASELLAFDSSRPVVSPAPSHRHHGGLLYGRPVIFHSTSSAGSFILMGRHDRVLSSVSRGCPCDCAVWNAAAA